MPDVILAALITAAQLALTRASAGWDHGTVPGSWDYIVLGIGGAALAVRQRYPVGVLAVALATTFLVRVAGHVNAAWVTLIAAFVNAVIARRRAAAIISLLCGYLVSVWPPSARWRRASSPFPSNRRTAGSGMSEAPWL